MSRSATNFISEWFGHRVFPDVNHQEGASEDQRKERCPFLSESTGRQRQCVKSKSSRGVCTVSSTSNGSRQDWLVCPYRGLDRSLILEMVEGVFGASSDRWVVPASSLSDGENQAKFLSLLEKGEKPVAFFQTKLGGEISIPRTRRSPEMSFDLTVGEFSMKDGRLSVSRYGMLELQTMDFHGSYRHAVKNLEDAQRLHGEQFHATLQKNQFWLGDRIEGPNIANVFKRTFYQMMFKFQLASLDDCAGTVLALPEAVWDSWQRHLVVSAQ